MVDLKELDIKELKVLAFDTIAKQEQIQMSLKAVIEEINSRNTKPKVEK